MMSCRRGGLPARYNGRVKVKTTGEEWGVLHTSALWKVLKDDCPVVLARVGADGNLQQVRYLKYGLEFIGEVSNENSTDL